MENCEFAQSYKDNKWDGYVRFYDQKKQTFPTGFRKIVTDALRESGFEVTVYREFSFKTKEEFSESINQRPYQKAALIKFFKETHCIIEVPTRGGKTFIAAEAIRHLQQAHEKFTTLFFTDTTDLFKQSKKDISNHLKIPESEIGEIKGEVFNIKPVTVCTIQTITSILSSVSKIKPNTKEALVKQKKDKLKSLLSYFSTVDMIIVDECHEYSSDLRLSCLKRFMETAKFKLFISASPFKSENELDNMNLRSVSGVMGYKIHESDLKEQGFLSKDKILLLYIDHDLNKNVQTSEELTYRELLKLTITHNHFRNSTMINCTEILRRLHLKTLIMFSIKEHGYWVKSINEVPFVSGDTSSEDRDFIKNTFLKKKGGILMASDIFKKGITLPEVQVLFNVSGGLEQSTITQKKGRVLGVTDDKNKALIIDFIDQGKYFSEHSLSRIEVYEKSVGKDNIVILDTDDNDFYEHFREFVKNWFELN